MADACVIGVDLGGTKLLAGTVDAQLRVHHRAYRLSRPDGGRRDDRRGRRGGPPGDRGPRSAAVGVGIPCLIEPATGVAMACNHFPLLDVPLRDLLAERLGLPVVVDNDANAAMLAERRHGAARGARNVALLTLGTGIGGGMLVDGRIVRGAHGRGRRARAHRRRRRRAAVPGQLPEPRLPGGVRVGHGARARGPGAAPRRSRDSGLGRALAGGREITGPLVTELAHDGDAAARDGDRRRSAATSASGSRASSTSSTPRSSSSAAASSRPATCCSSRRARVVAERALAPVARPGADRPGALRRRSRGCSAPRCWRWTSWSSAAR